MLPYSDRRITKLLFVIFFLCVAGYAYYEARALLFGPVINVPDGIREVHAPFVHITGSAQRIVSLSMNGREIAVTEAGAFDEPFLLSSGLNHIMLDAKDKYGHITSKMVQIVFTPDPNATTTPMSATSTATSTTPLPLATTTQKTASSTAHSATTTQSSSTSTTTQKSIAPNVH